MFIKNYFIDACDFLYSSFIVGDGVDGVTHIYTEDYFDVNGTRMMSFEMTISDN